MTTLSVSQRVMWRKIELSNWFIVKLSVTFFNFIECLCYNCLHIYAPRAFCGVASCISQLLTDGSEAENVTVYFYYHTYLPFIHLYYCDIIIIMFDATIIRI